MKIIVIGSKGFIGSHCLSFFTKNHDTWGCDIINDYNDNNYFMINATNSSYEKVFKKIKFDICINCSGSASVPLSLNYPQVDYELNAVNVFRLLEAIRCNHRKCKFINLSSAAVYGNPEKLPIIESHSLNPISPYGLHKLHAEQICREFNTFYQIPTCSLRVFSAYGAGLKKQLFWDLYQQSLNSVKISLFGTGNESRDFIHVADIVNAIDLIINNAMFCGEVINVANGQEIYINDVVKLFFEKLNCKKEVEFVGSNRKGDPLNWCADITSLNSMGYRQSVSLESGLTDLITKITQS